MPIKLKTQEEIEQLRQGGRVLATVLGELVAMVKPGTTTQEIEEYAEKRTIELGAIPAFKGYTSHGSDPFPTCLCVSVNEEVVHAPSLPARALKDGDVVSIDYGVQYPKENGLYTDMAVTVGVGLMNPDQRKLITAARRALMQGLKQVKAGKTVRDISSAIQKFVEREGFSIVREFVGHGVGYAIHEEPRIPNYVDESLPRVELREGMVLAIEPMITAGDSTTETLEDGWTAATKDKSLAAHYEMTVAVTKKGYELLTKI